MIFSFWRRWISIFIRIVLFSWGRSGFAIWGNQYLPRLCLFLSSNLRFPVLFLWFCSQEMRWFPRCSFSSATARTFWWWSRWYSSQEEVVPWVAVFPPSRSKYCHGMTPNHPDKYSRPALYEHPPASAFHPSPLWVADAAHRFQRQTWSPFCHIPRYPFANTKFFWCGWSSYFSWLFLCVRWNYGD